MKLRDGYFWPCDCAAMEHGLVVIQDWTHDHLPIIEMNEETRFWLYDGWSLPGWWKRLRAAFAILRGEWHWCGVVLNPETVQEMAAVFTEIAQRTEAAHTAQRE